MAITEPAVPSARLLGLGSKLYLSNMRRMLNKENKDLIRFMQSLSRVRQNQASERKVLLSEQQQKCFSLFFVSTNRFFMTTVRPTTKMALIPDGS